MKYKLSELVDINKKTISKEYSGSIKYIDTSSVNNGVFDKPRNYESIQEAPSRARRLASSGDILFSTVRPNMRHMGFIARDTKYVFSTGFAVISPKQNLVDPYYLYLFLSTNKIINLLQNIGETATSAYPSIKPGDIAELIIDLPPLESQKNISHRIKIIDRKIQNNRAINANLFKLSNIIFESIIQNEQPTIKFSKIATIQNGFAFKSKEYINDKQTLVLRTKNIGSDHLFNKDDIVYISNKSFNNYKKFTFKPFDTTLVMVGASIGKTGFITSNVIPSLQNQNMWRFRSNKLPGLLIYEYVTFINKNVKNAATGSARSFYRKELFNDFNVPFIDAVYFPIFDKLQQELDNLNGESETLKKLRNVLMNRYF